MNEYFFLYFIIMNDISYNFAMQITIKKKTHKKKQTNRLDFSIIIIFIYPHYSSLK